MSGASKGYVQGAAKHGQGIENDGFQEQEMIRAIGFFIVTILMRINGLMVFQLFEYILQRKGICDNGYLLMSAFLPEMYTI